MTLYEFEEIKKYVDEQRASLNKWWNNLSRSEEMFLKSEYDNKNKQISTMEKLVDGYEKILNTKLKDLLNTKLKDLFLL